LAEKPVRQRKITIRFPEDHPIWNIPSGQRSQTVRDLVDIALAGSRSTELLADILQVLERIEGCMNKVSFSTTKQEEAQEESVQEQEKGGNPIPVETFLNFKL
jgi:hypothetical protein